MSDEESRPSEGPAGRPGDVALRTMAGAALSAIPVAGPVLSGLFSAKLQADTARRLNEAFEELERSVAQSARSTDELLRDPIFRRGVAVLYASVVGQEAEEKIRRVQNFVRHQLGSHQIHDLTGDAVLDALESLPSSHIETFLSLLGSTVPELAEFSAVVGDHELSSIEIVEREMPGRMHDDYCGSPSNERHEALEHMFQALRRAGLVAGQTEHPGVWVTTTLAKRLVAFVIDPTEAESHP